MASESKYYVHIADAGETWDSISYDAYLSEMNADTILQANPALADIVVFEGGEEVIVPYIDKARTYDSLPPWMRP